MSPSSDPPPASEPAKAANTESPQTQSQAKPLPKPKEPVASSEGSKLSGAEAKKRAKEEKAARRAQALQSKQSSGAPQSSAPAPGQFQKAEGGKGPKQQKVEIRNQPSKGGPKISVVTPMVPKAEDKTVEFFRHLYKTRTTTIAGAGKEVHPAVLALGLQMSNYTICGSCARLVATLQAFKRVSRGYSFWF